MTATPYPLSAIRALALHTQRLDRANSSEPAPGAEAVCALVDQLGAVQIDTLHTVARSQYLVLWARLGTYDPLLLDRLTYTPGERRLFEGWQHAACFLPLAEYRYQMPKQRALRMDPDDWYTRWLHASHHQDTVDFVRTSITRQGARRLSDFERGDHPPGSWWNWRPAKVALEYLFAVGECMISNRVNFQRVYDLTARVLPDWVDTREPSAEERDRFWVERGARALGICLPRNAADYTWMKLGKGRGIIAELVRSGRLVEVQGRLAGGSSETLLVHRDNLPLLEQAAAGMLAPQRTTFLSPFDSLFWASGRDEAFWGFRQRLEAYLPAPRRTYGYYSMPILHRDRLVGRFDPKVERRQGIMRLKSLHLEPGIRPDDELVAAVAGAMRDFMTFHSAKELVIDSSQPPQFGKKLLKALPGGGTP